MKLNKILFLIIITTFLFSCIDDDGDTSTPITFCNDNDYYAFFDAAQSNPDNIVDVIKNTTSNITTTNISMLTNVDFPPEARNANGTWNKVTNTLFYLDESEREYALSYDLATNTANNHSIAALTTGRLTAPVYNQNKLFMLDIDNSGNVDIKTLNSSFTVLSPSIANFPAATVPNSPDTQETLAYGATDENCLIYFLVGNTIIEYDQCFSSPSSPPYTTYSINMPGTYLDIAYRQNGNLISVRKDNVTNNLEVVELDLTASPGVATVISVIPTINANEESIQLTYKECGDRVQVLTHFNNSTSTVVEVNMSTLNVISENFNGWIFGMVHDQQ